MRATPGSAEASLLVVSDIIAAHQTRSPRV